MDELKYAKIIEEFQKRANVSRDSLSIMLKLSPCLLASLVQGETDFIRVEAFETLDILEEIIQVVYKLSFLVQDVPTKKAEYVRVHQRFRMPLENLCGISVYDYLMTYVDDPYAARTCLHALTNYLPLEELSSVGSTKSN